MKKIVSLSALALITAAFSACSSHQNPLTLVDEKEAAIFLLKASQSAEKALHIKKDTLAGGDIYGLCLKEEAQNIDCKALYGAMVKYAQTTTHFKNLKVSDLTDPVMWKSLHEYYDTEVFNAI